MLRVLNNLKKRIEQFDDLQRHGAGIFIITQFQGKVLKDKIEGEELRIVVKRLEENFDTLVETLLQN